jgi:hypothetical protein
MHSGDNTFKDLVRLRLEIEEFIDHLIRELDKLDSEFDDYEDGDEDDDLETEPSLGSTNELDQTNAWQLPVEHSPDLEEDDNVVGPHSSDC